MFFCCMGSLRSFFLFSGYHRAWALKKWFLNHKNRGLGEYLWLTALGNIFFGLELMFCFCWQVRVNALLCLSDMVHILDKHAVMDILQTIQRCTTVDHSAPTLMCTLGVANSISKQYGIEFTVEHVLPLLLPLLIAQQLNVQQFAKYMLFVKDILRKIEEKRGVTLTDSGVPEVRPSPASDGCQSELVTKTVASASPTTRGGAWDEDWIPTRGPATTLLSSMTSTSSIQSAVANQSIHVSSTNSQSSTTAASSQQIPLSCPAVDVEWPPRSSCGGTTALGDHQKLDQNRGATNANFEDIDPFADWPPRPNGSSNATGSAINSTIAPSAKKYGSSLNASNLNGLNFPANSNTTWAFSQNSVEPLKQNQENSTFDIGILTSGGIKPHNSLGSLKQQSHGISGLSGSTEKARDLGSIFGSTKAEQTAPRLAPPPLTAVGRGRGRGRGNQEQRGATSVLRSSNTKPPLEQPPLMDLL
ncbi:unnamed protein product [Ilex paraguariensis]|uniref:SCY1-like protein 2 n=1 Tax=Ilex paraguariensis TaxID=185542 RepID=A0ABC8RSD7_9AQUA